MALGILQPKGGEKVPGSVFLDDAQASDAQQRETADLKRGAGRDSHIILAPQPSRDPNDPLNWSRTERLSIVAVLFLGTIVNAACVGSLLAAGTYQISVNLGASVQDVALLAGYNLLSTGAAAPVVSIMSRKFGKRPQYLIASTLALIAVLLGETANSYSQLLASRIIHGFSASAYESIIMASIGDLFFVHERGRLISMSQFFLAAISNLTSVISGVITTHLGWPFNYHILMPFVGLQLLLVILFCPETTFKRSEHYEIDTATSEGNSSKNTGDSIKEVKELEDVLDVEDSQKISRFITDVPAQRDSFFQRMRPYSVRIEDVSLTKAFLALPIILLNVGAIFGIVVSGVLIAWYIGITLLVSVILAEPPYSYTSAAIGYASTGPFIGGILGFLFMSFFAESVARYLTRKNHGVYEPEFRLPLIVIGGIISIGGLIGVGHSLQDARSIFVIATLWGVTLFGITIVVIVCGQYSLDAWRPHSTEIFIMNATFKNFFFYGLISFVFKWQGVVGTAKMLDTMAGMTAALCMTALPLYIYGKKYRAFWSRNNLVKKFGLETTEVGTEVTE